MSVRLLFLPFTILLFLWITIGFVKPNWIEYKNAKIKVEELTRTKNKLAQGISNIKKAVSEYRNLDETTLSYINNALPPVKNDDNLVAEINKDANQAGVLITEINVAKDTRHSNGCPLANNKKTFCLRPPKMMKVNLSAVGSYLSVKDFVKKLDVQNRVIVPTSLAMGINKENNKEEERSGLISTKSSFNVYYKVENEKIKLSQSIDTNTVLKSLLDNGLDKNVINKLAKIVTSGVFEPIQVDTAGKEDLFRME